MPDLTAKQDREAEHIKESEEARGVPEKKAESIGFATVESRKKGMKRDGTPRKKYTRRSAMPGELTHKEGKDRVRHEQSIGEWLFQEGEE